ncbi:MAG: type II toxin-antitoxin system VapC family toxin [Panacagrimonas sp.]
MRLLLDTSACIGFIRDQPRGVRRILASWSEGHAGICSIVLAELELCIALSERAAAGREALSALLDVLSVLPWPIEAAQVYGGLRAQLRRTGKLIGPNDLLIAAHALTLDLPLMTGNLDEFRRVPGLRVLPLPKR